jgi:hypothetical protein
VEGLKDHFAERLVEEMNRYRPLRALGTAALFGGLACTVATGSPSPPAPPAGEVVALTRQAA